ncbi:Hypothetical predicted protein [Octopus vulgaris]|uniref:Uncharacterized protein n=1 Tax=Octopus vulgaris TaxID=6645 RepID=A0AA36AKG0_OCTVU|nr:Hypothetical predicted protein [Octopus vulgaris]
MDIDGYHSFAGEYASNPPPKPAHGIMRTEFSMPAPSTTHYNEEVLEVNDNIVLRRKSNDTKKFVHFRESRDITYYPEPYETIVASSTGEFDQCDVQLSSVCPSEQNNDIGDLDMTVVSGYSSDGRALSGGYNDGYPLRMPYNDEKNRIMNHPSRNDMRKEIENATCPSQPAVLNSKVSYRPQYLDFQEDSYSITAGQTTQPKLKIRPESPAHSLVSNLKLSAIGPVYILNRNTSTRSSGTFISLIGRVPIDVNKMKHPSRECVPKPVILTKNIQIFQKSLANEAMDQIQDIQKAWTLRNGDYVEGEEINGNFSEFHVNENYGEQTNNYYSEGKDSIFCVYNLYGEEHVGKCL